MGDTGLKILIVEDQFLIAKQVEWIVTTAGHHVIGIAGTLSDACRLAMAEEPHLAFVDLSLADGQTGAAVGQFIKNACKTEVVYTTANLRLLPDDFAGALGAVEKPFTKGDLLAALAYIVAIVTNGLVPAQVPNSLKLAPPQRV
ncbi:MAG: response regulator [Microvirga sp.]|nr:response regulator [Microvirga sp.]